MRFNDSDYPYEDIEFSDLGEPEPRRARAVGEVAEAAGQAAIKRIRPGGDCGHDGDDNRASKRMCSIAGLGP